VAPFCGSRCVCVCVCVWKQKDKLLFFGYFFAFELLHNVVSDFCFVPTVQQVRVSTAMCSCQRRSESELASQRAWC